MWKVLLRSVGAGDGEKKRPKNILVADFDGDQKNEILTTDNAYRVTLLKDNGDITEQKWLYPYSLPTSGKVAQVFAEKQ